MLNQNHEKFIYDLKHAISNPPPTMRVTLKCQRCNEFHIKTHATREQLHQIFNGKFTVSSTTCISDLAKAIIQLSLPNKTEE
jgi:hypothetical protein